MTPPQEGLMHDYVHSNLMLPLFQLALSGETPVVRHYHADLGHDAVSLLHSEPGDVYLWGCRECGTHMFRLHPETRGRRFDVAVVTQLSVAPANWHVVTITKKTCGGDIAEGTVRPLGATTRDEAETLVRALMQASCPAG
jgi:hypothetical protein